jgi:hypothetical protein
VGALEGIRVIDMTSMERVSLHEQGGWTTAKILLATYGHYMRSESEGFADALSTAQHGPGPILGSTLASWVRTHQMKIQGVTTLRSPAAPPEPRSCTSTGGVRNADG